MTCSCGSPLPTASATQCDDCDMSRTFGTVEVNVDREIIRKAEDAGFVREPTMGGHAAYDEHISEDAREARAYLRGLS